METKVFSQPEADLISEVTVQQTFERYDGMRILIPREGTEGACMYRAHVRAMAFKELGIEVKKVFFHHRYIDNDGKKRGGIVNPDEPGDRWSFHATICIQLETDSGIEILIIDPAPDQDNPRPLWTIEEWAKWLGYDPGSYKIITALKEWQEKLEQEHLKYPEVSDQKNLPADQPYLLITDRDHVVIPNRHSIEGVSHYKDIPDQYGNMLYMMQGQKMLEDEAENIPFYQIRNKIGKKIQDGTIQGDQDAEKFLTAITEKFEESKSKFLCLKASSSTQFSSLYSDAYERFITHLQERAISSALVESFKKYLSG